MLRQTPIWLWLHNSLHSIRKPPEEPPLTIAFYCFWRPCLPLHSCGGPLQQRMLGRAAQRDCSILHKLLASPLCGDRQELRTASASSPSSDAALLPASARRLALWRKQAE